MLFVKAVLDELSIFFFFFEVVRRLEEALRKVNLMFIRAKSQCESEI